MKKGINLIRENTATNKSKCIIISYSTILYHMYADSQ